MGRLIDADTYSNKLQEEISWHDPKDKVVRILQSIQQDLSNPIETPTVEPKKGKWTKLNDEHGTIICSVCEEDAFWEEYWDGITWYEFDFCPHCGADMREEENE